MRTLQECCSRGLDCRCVNCACCFQLFRSNKGAAAHCVALLACCTPMLSCFSAHKPSGFLRSMLTCLPALSCAIQAVSCKPVKPARPSHEAMFVQAIQVGMQSLSTGYMTVLSAQQGQHKHAVHQWHSTYSWTVDPCMRSHSSGLCPGVCWALSLIALNCTGLRHDPVSLQQLIQSARR